MGSPALDQSALHLRFGDFTLVLQADDWRLTTRVARYFWPFVSLSDTEPSAALHARAKKEPLRAVEFAPWDGRGKESMADYPDHRLIRKDRTGVLISVNGTEWSISGDLNRNFSQLINIIGTMYGVWLLDQGSSMIHASAVVRYGRAIAITGESGQGKSSVAVRLLERDFDFLTNDRLIVQLQGEGIAAYGVPKLPRVNPGTLLAGKRTRSLVDAASRSRYAKLSKQALWDLEDKRDLDVRASLGRRWMLSSPLAAAVVLGWRRGHRGLKLRRLHPDEAFERLRAAAKTFGPFDRRLRTRSDASLQEMARMVPAYLATGAIDPTRLAREVSNRLLEGQPLNM